MDGCEWDDETGEVTGYRQIGYDGEDFISLDLKTETWIAPTPQSVITKLKWDQDKAGLAYLKNVFTQVCPTWLKKHLEFTLSDPAELSALKVPGWRTRSGKKMKWKTMVTTRTKRAPSWLRSGRGGALSAAFHKKSTFILAGLVSRVSRVDLRPSLPPSG